jgi:glycosyltransferase involved in cell wall biosynthesis
LEEGLKQEQQSDEKIFSNTERGEVKIEIIIPTLNEEKTIEELINNIRSCLLPIELSILVIDGGSTDRTVDICKSRNVRFLVQKGKGKGNAMREAVDHSEADIVVFIDGDGTYSPSDLGLLLEPLLNGKSDMVVGSRMLGKRQRGAISIFHTLGNKLFNRAINFAMKSSITDSLSGYRALYKKTFSDLILFSDSFEIEVEMTVEALAKGYKVLEVPINYSIRKGSDTKLDPFGDGIKISRTLLFILMNVNPLKFFVIISLGFFAIALWSATYPLYEKITYGEITSIPAAVLSALLFVGGTLSIVVGMVSELVVRSRRRLEHLINRKLEK